jgi:hypothetical protein
MTPGTDAIWYATANRPTAASLRYSLTAQRSLASCSQANTPATMKYLAKPSTEDVAAVTSPAEGCVGDAAAGSEAMARISTPDWNAYATATPTATASIATGAD